MKHLSIESVAFLAVYIAGLIQGSLWGSLILTAWRDRTVRSAAEWIAQKLNRRAGDNSNA